MTVSNQNTGFTLPSRQTAVGTWVQPPPQTSKLANLLFTTSCNAGCGGGQSTIAVAALAQHRADSQPAYPARHASACSRAVVKQRWAPCQRTACRHRSDHAGRTATARTGSASSAVTRRWLIQRAIPRQRSAAPPGPSPKNSPASASGFHDRWPGAGRSGHQRVVANERAIAPVGFHAARLQVWSGRRRGRTTGAAGFHLTPQWMAMRCAEHLRCHTAKSVMLPVAEDIPPSAPFFMLTLQLTAHGS